MRNARDVRILRELARQYVEIANKDIQNERRDLWRKHNSFVRTRPLVLVRWFASWKEIGEPMLQCEDPFYRQHEHFLRHMIFQDAIGDDWICEPWITQPATRVIPPEGEWGLQGARISSGEAGGSYKLDPPLKKPEDVARLLKPQHVIDEEDTARNVARLRDAVGDIVEVAVDRSPWCRRWHADISYDLAQLRGIEQILWDMVDNPEWLHGVLAFMRDGILAAQEQAEAAGDWCLHNHENQAMSYAQELPDPQLNGSPVMRDKLWCFVAAQEMAVVSPAMHDEFILSYQLPIIEKFGLVAYGCCEDLTHKIDSLRKIPNLRRIAVPPAADVARCAEQIGRDYILSYRPNPAEMVCCGFDPDHIGTVIRHALEVSKGCHVDITLKDIQTVENHPERLREWVKIVREVSDAYA